MRWTLRQLRQLARYRVQALRRFGIAALVAALTFVVAMPVLRPFERVFPLVLAWDAFALALLVQFWHVILRADAAQTRRRAGGEDPGRNAVWLIIVAACVVSLLAAVVGLRRARTLPGALAPLLGTASLGAVVLSWLVLHTAFTLRYAHLYYREDEDGVGGLLFPGGSAPDDLDFAYFSFTLGMCFQTSDVAIDGKSLRREALVHAVLSFAFNTTLLALALNMSFSAFG